MPSLNRKRLIVSSVISLIGVAAAGVVFAQTSPDLGLEQVDIGLTTRDIREVVSLIIRSFLSLLGIVAVAIVLYGGFLWMTAQGNEEQVAKAKRLLTSAIIGIFIILSAYAIASYVINALVKGTGMGGGGGSCPSGNCVSEGGGLVGSGRAFYVQGIEPSGAGPGQDGWPRNYGLTVKFNRNVDAASVTPTTVVVTRCNRRTAAFDVGSCDTPVSGTVAASGSTVTFRPDATPGENPTYFEADYWYRLRVMAGGSASVRSSDGLALNCAMEILPLDTTGAAVSRYCARATAFGDKIDVSAPTLTVNSPAGGAAYCAGAPLPTPVVATATDDFLATQVEFWLDDNSVAALIDEAGETPAAPAVAFNSEQAMPSFVAAAFRLNMAQLEPGPHRLAARASDGVPLQSQVVERSFRVNPGYCCNNVQDGDETSVDCGGSCGGCLGTSCTGDADCASGYCDAASGQCAARPIIEVILPPAGAGPGSIVTIRGRSFGSVPGTVTFLGADTDGNGDPEGDSDDVIAAMCASQGWKSDEAKVYVPVGAKTGPVKLATASGPADRTDDAVGPALGSYAVTTEMLPGICWLEPSEGPSGSSLTVHGANFGSAKGASELYFGAYVPVIMDGGWSDSAIRTVVPPLPDGNYDVLARVGGANSNVSNYFLHAPAAATAPTIVSVSPDNGPPGTYVTIVGSGFGTRPGLVTFKYGADTAYGAETVCGNIWRDNYIVVKLPERYGSGQAPTGLVQLAAHNVQVSTSAPTRLSNSDVVFTVASGQPKPGICRLEPDNGPPGTLVTLSGENFGTPAVIPSLDPTYSVDFPKVRQTLASSWNPGVVTVVTPGDRANKTTWPASGNVSLVAANVESANAIPFRVQDCNEAGVTCATGTICCASGACAESCTPPARESAYGWLMSTEVLPNLPMVVERSYCTTATVPPVLQSPSPYPGTTGACIDSLIRVEFTRYMDTGTPGIVEVAACGTGAASGSCTALPQSGFRNTWTDCAPDGNGCRALRVSPQAATPLSASTWYRVTLKSDAGASVGLRDVAGRYLDGDKNRVQGGDYVFSFRTRDDASPCDITAISVDPGRQVIGRQDLAYPFRLALLHDCNELQCQTPPPAVLSWSQAASYLLIADAPPVGDACGREVRGGRETPSGQPTQLIGQASTADPARNFTSSSEVTVKFLDLQVVSVTPVGGCLEACTNALISAKFNVPVDPQSINDQTVHVWRCRNASCLPPFDVSNPSDPPGCHATAVLDGGEYRKAVIDCDRLTPSTFYAVTVGGGDGGVKSATGGLLAGTNAGVNYQWSFRTKDAPRDTCDIDSLSVEPSETVLHYVSERSQLFVSARGPRDTCDPEGQELDVLDYSWIWEYGRVKANAVLGGFVTDSFASPGPFPLDTRPRPAAGCGPLCLPTGATGGDLQCGDGRLNPYYEACEYTAASASWCSTSCLLRGTTAPTCGNGRLDAGENCERVSGVFPIGCKDPAVAVEGYPAGVGCVLMGAAAGGATCGDGYRGEGEECDDGNARSGDGCSADCLLEGSARSCSVGDANCSVVCGNGVAEPGEDPECEPSPNAKNCNISTCLKRGTVPCRPGSVGACCGNGVVDAGEDSACETWDERGEICTDRCLLKGSSYDYSRASFCGDAVVSRTPSERQGFGEKAACEVGSPDGLIDPYQVVEAEPQPPTFAPGTEAGITSVVTAFTQGVDPGRAGEGKVSLDCSCRTAGTNDAERDAYCAEYLPSGSGVDLGCDKSGCCRPRPRVTFPAEGEICRNSAITFSFDQTMDRSSLTQNVRLLVDSGTAGTGLTEAEKAAVCAAGLSEAPRTSWLARLWDAVKRFVRPIFGRPASGAGAPGGNVFCPWPMRLEVVDNGDSTIVTVSPTKAFKPSTWVRVEVGAAARSSEGVAMGVNSLHYEFAGKDLCLIRRVDVVPSHVLVNNALVKDYPVMARAFDSLVPGEGREIKPVEEYDWGWSWSVKPLTDPLVVAPRLAEDGSQTSTASVHARNPALGDSPKDYVPHNGTSVISVDANPKPDAKGTIDGVYTGRGEATILLCDNPWPRVYECPASGRLAMPWGETATCLPGPFWLPYRDTSTRLSFYYCRDGQEKGLDGRLIAALPAFRESPTVITPGRDILREYLFTYDLTAYPPYGLGAAWANDAIGLRVNKNEEHFGIGTWYQSKGFTGNPEPVQALGYDGLRDGRTVYLPFATLSTMNRAYTNILTLTYSDQSGSVTQGIVNQILTNLDFNYSLLEEGTCRAVSASQELDGKRLNCAADSDCWSDATGAIVASRQARYACDQAVGFCAVTCATDDDCRRGPDGQPVAAYSSRTCNTQTKRCVAAGVTVHELGVGLPVACSDALSCQRRSDGEYDPARVGYRCDAPKSEIARDVRRFTDLLSMRGLLLASRAKTGSVPRLSSGTFVPGTTVSTWSSWNEFLFPALGGALASDPLNRMAICQESGYEPTACWNQESQTYRCPAMSHVYQYQGLGGQDFILKADGETEYSWQGTTCLDYKTLTSCNGDGECVWRGNQCHFKEGDVLFGRVNVPVNCTGALVGQGLVCGDGIVNPQTEQCERGQTQVVTCCAYGPANNRQSHEGVCTGTEGTDPRQGTQTKVCANNCSAMNAATACAAGSCGDGVIQAPEACDDGPLNGTYGNCKSDCSGAGPRCGDSLKQPGETCDCGGKNGQYYFNGVLSTATDTTGVNACGSTVFTAANVPSCAWDCSSAGPRCGDSVVNDSEQCDGGYEEFKGYCSNTAQTGCNADGDCPAGSCSSGSCTNEPGRACSSDNDCRLTCGHFCPTPEQVNRRTCKSNNPTLPGAVSCTWNAWTCTAPGSCGNGRRESGEQCDDGNTNNNDACVIDPAASRMCVANVCGDGYVNVGVEECDAGTKNGTACLPEYGFTCNYCTPSCKIATVTGGFCGDRILQDGQGSNPPGPETCDGSSGASQWICVSVKPQDQSYGVKTGGSACNDSCKRGCDDQNSRPCQVSGGDFDSDGIADVCDPDDDNDGAPDVIDCAPKDSSRHPAYSPGGILAGLELCDGIDNDCNLIVDDLPGVYRAVDMVFAVDISGSMQSTIDGISDAISSFVSRYQGTDHRFGIVLFGQSAQPSPPPSLTGLETAGPDGRVVINLSDVSSFSEQFARISADGGGVEPMFSVLYALSDPANLFGINWRREAHPFVVVVTDESTPGGNGTSAPPHATAAQAESKVRPCLIGDCVDRIDPEVEVYVITKDVYRDPWGPILKYEYDERWVEIAVPEGTTPGDYYFAQLGETVFANVCPTSQ